VPNKGSYRVVQWTTGNVGKSSVAAIAKNPHSELVGLYAWSDDNPMWIDVDELVRILEAGVNVVATASFITGHNQGGGRDSIAEACRRGGSTMFGSGISPGYVNQPSIVAAGICDRVDKVTVNEAADITFYDSPATKKPVGFGQLINHPDLQAMTEHGTGVFGEAVRMVADALGIELDEVRCDAEYAQTTEDFDLGSGRSRRAASRACTPAGRASSEVRPGSRATCGGAKANRWNPIGRSIRTAG